jgi:VanZ family protein
MPRSAATSTIGPALYPPRPMTTFITPQPTRLLRTSAPAKMQKAILVMIEMTSISPEKKAGVRSKKVWIYFLILLCYAAIDEWLQGFEAGRTRDFMDFIANL